VGVIAHLDVLKTEAMPVLTAASRYVCRMTSGEKQCTNAKTFDWISRNYSRRAIFVAQPTSAFG
jgi:hypothetical protein